MDPDEQDQDPGALQRAEPADPPIEGYALDKTERVVSETKVDETVLNPLNFEDAAAEFLNFFPQTVLDALASKQWKDRLTGLASIHTRLDQGDVTALCHCALYVLHKTPGWKEVNIQVTSSLFEAVTKLALTSDAFSNKLAALPLVCILNKLGDPKVAPAAKDCAVALCEALGAETIIPMVISRIGTVKNPKALQGIAKTLQSITEDFSASCVPIKPIIETGKSLLGHGTVGVRNDATALLREVYRQAGSAAMLNLIVDGLKPALAKAIETELGQITPGAPVLPSRFKRGQKPTGPAAAAVGLLLADRVDISPKVTSKLLKQMEDDAWKERKEALDSVMRILDEARHAIQPNIKSLIKSVLARIGDANKLLVLTALTVLRTLGEDIGVDAAYKHAKAVVPVVLTQVADSKKHIAAEARATLLCWLGEGGLAIGLPFITKAMETTVLLRDGLLDTLLQRIQPDNLELAAAQALLNPVFLALQDKIPGVRQKSEKLFALLIAKIGIANIRNDVASLSRTSQIAINAVIDKFGAQGGDVPGADVSSGNFVKAPGAAVAKPFVVRSRSAQAKPLTERRADDGPQQRKGLSRTLRKSKPEAKRVLKRSKSVEPVTPGRPRHPIGESSDLYVCDGRASAARRESRWRQGPIGFQEWLGADVLHLKELLSAYVSPELLGAMFADDFQKQIIAIDLFHSSIDQSLDAIVSLRDLVLMWISLRIAEDKTQVVVKILNLCMAILSSEIDFDEYDANCLIPVIVEKLLAHNKQPLRVRGRELLHKASDTWSSTTIGKFLLDGIVMSKSVRAKSVCIEELLFLASEGTFDVVVPKKTLQAVAEFVTSHDAPLRKASIALIEKGFNELGDAVFWSRISSDLSDRNRATIEKLLKRGCQPQQAPSPRFGHISRPRTKLAELPVFSSVLGSAAPPTLEPEPVPAPTGSQINASAPKTLPFTPVPTFAELDKDIFKLDLDDLPFSGETSVAIRKDASVGDTRDDHSFSRMVVTAETESKENNSAATLDAIILQLESIDEDARIDAMRMLAQLTEHCDSEAQILVRRANTIVGLLLCYFHEASELDALQFAVTKPVVHTLMELLKSSSFALELSVPTLTSFYQTLLPVLGTGNTRSSSEHKSMRSFVNVLVTKSLEITDRTRCYCALIRGMNDFWSFGYDKKDKSVSTLYCRCLAKLARGLHLCHQRLEITPLLEEIDQFLERHPETFWSTFASELGQNMPWNLVYTLVMTLIKLRGNSFLSDLPTCTSMPNSVLKKIVLEKLSSLESDRSSALDPNLVDILRRVRDNSPDAMRELNQYQTNNPCVDLESYLSDIPDSVKQTVLRRMSLIEAAVPAASPTPASETAHTLESFQARLRSLQSRASSQDPPVQRSSAVGSNADPQSSSIIRIRQRLQSAQISLELKEPSAAGGGAIQSSSTTDSDSQKVKTSLSWDAMRARIASSTALHAESVAASDSQSRASVASLDAIRARIAKLRAASSSSVLP